MVQKCRKRGWLWILVLLVLAGMIAGTAQEAYAFTTVRDTEEPYIGDITHGILNDLMRFYGYDVDGFLAGDTGEASWLLQEAQAAGDFRSPYRNDVSPYGLGTERTSAGVPDLKAFNRKGQVCASFVTMVYNYLDYRGFSAQTSELYQKVKAYNNSDTGEYQSLYTYNVRTWNRECEKLVKQGKMKVITDYRELEYGDIIIFASNLNGGEWSQNAHIGISLGPVIINGYKYHTMIQHRGEDNGNGPIYSAVEQSAINADPEFVGTEITEVPVRPSTAKLLFRVAYRFTDNPFENQAGGIKVQVQDENGAPIRDVKFGVYSDSACTRKVSEIITDENGQAYYGKDSSTGEFTLEKGSVYYLKELSVPGNEYKINKEVYSATIVKNQWAAPAQHETIVNQLNGGSLAVKTVNEYGDPIQGVVLGIYSDSACTQHLDSVISDSEGRAVYGIGSDGSYTLKDGSVYYVKEIYVPENYDIDTTIYSGTAECGRITQINGDTGIVHTYTAEYPANDRYYTGLWYRSSSEDWLYVENGSVNKAYSGLTWHCGNWYYVEKGVLNWNYSGLTCFYGTWYYVEDGMLDWNYSGLTCFYGTWYYVEDGMLNWNYSGLTYYRETWYYVENGVLNWNYSGLAWHCGNWYYVERGVLNWNYSGLTSFYGTWYYVEEGMLDWNYSGLTCYYGTWYYVSGGILDWNYSGYVKYNGKWYYVKRGIVS